MESNFDPEAQAAIDELASQLQPAIRDVIGAAIHEALDKIDGTLQSRRGEIDAASERIEEVLADLGKEMKTKAGVALNEGIQQRVVPAIEEECRKIAESAANIVGPRLESAERVVSALDASVKDVEHHLTAAFQRNGEASIAALSAAQGTITDVINDHARSSQETTSSGLGQLHEKMERLTVSFSEQLQALFAEAEHKTRELLTEGGARQETFSHQLRAENQQIALRLESAEKTVTGLGNQFEGLLSGTERHLQQLITEDGERRTREVLADSEAQQKALSEQLRNETEQVRPSLERTEQAISTIGVSTTNMESLLVSGLAQNAGATRAALVEALAATQGTITDIINDHARSSRESTTSGIGQLHEKIERLTLSFDEQLRELFAEAEKKTRELLTEGETRQETFSHQLRAESQQIGLRLESTEKILAAMGNQFEGLASGTEKHLQLIGEDGERRTRELLADSEARQKALSEQLRDETVQIRPHIESTERAISTIGASTKNMESLLATGLAQNADATKAALSSTQQDLSDVMDKNAKILGSASSTGFHLLGKQLDEMPGSIENQLRTFSTEIDRRSTESFKDAKSRIEALSEQFRNELSRVVAIQSEAKKEILLAITQQGVVSQQSSREVTDAFGNFHTRILVQMETDKGLRDEAHRSVINHLRISSVEQQRRARQNSVVAVVIVILLMTILVISLHPHWQ